MLPIVLAQVELVEHFPAPCLPGVMKAAMAVEMVKMVAKANHSNLAASNLGSLECTVFFMPAASLDVHQERW